MRNSSLFIKTLIIFTLFLFSQNANALSKVGHQVICQLAYDNLSSSVQKSITQLLKEIPKKHKKLINKYNKDAKKTNITFAKACSWADAVRNYKHYKKFNQWHYINVARNQTIVTPKSCKKHCITSAIEHHSRQLKTAKSSWKRVQALLFLGHWLGDIHQPMHVNFASDRGGNKTKIKWAKNQCKNMHTLWDNCLLKHSYKLSNAKLTNKLVEDLSQAWQQAPISVWQNSSLYTWATESLNIARMPSVLYCEINKNNVCKPVKKSKITLPNSYKSTHQPILKKRLLQAAVRLAFILENTL